MGSVVDIRQEPLDDGRADQSSIMIPRAMGECTAYLGRDSFKPMNKICAHVVVAKDF